MMTMTLIKLYKKLRCNSKGVVRDFRTDWRIDRDILRRNYLDGKSIQPFIHVANPTNTHMWFIHAENLDISCKHLFGYSTPRLIMNNVASLFSMQSFPKGVIQYYDGDTLRVITHDAAVTILNNAAMKKNPLIEAEC